MDTPINAGRLSLLTSVEENMPKHFRLYVYAALLSLAITGPCLAQTSESDATRPTDASLTEIVTWLAGKFDLPPIYDHPRVEFASPLQLARMRYSGLLSDRPQVTIGGSDPATPGTYQREVVAIYHDKSKTIFLPDGWNGKTPTEQSILVHEMVHHLQNMAGLKYECPAAREKPAYLAQDAWLQLHGLDLETEFEIDKFTLVANAACMF
jgi:hypothetical protein